MMNRRTLRSSLGSRTTRRAGTKTRDKRRRKEKPRSRLGRLIEAANRDEQHITQLKTLGR
jgi:hypothetical protein